MIGSVTEAWSFRIGRPFRRAALSGRRGIGAARPLLCRQAVIGIGDGEDLDHREASAAAPSGFGQTLILHESCIPMPAEVTERSSENDQDSRSAGHRTGITVIGTEVRPVHRRDAG
ncbi:hypothetical protein [Nocardia arthritidis]|uniref:hypothetical protein n=1 Tax=Nocardia arthritidis TaxID=228602 RepID=UPI0012EE6115|nr:hypothetical protein [Nocardia arthritidis]